MSNAEMKCPSCGSEEVWRDEVDVGVGIQCGPYGCICGWSEWGEYDQTSGPKFESGCRTDQYGGLHPVLIEGSPGADDADPRLVGEIIESARRGNVGGIIAARALGIDLDTFE